MIDMGQSQGNTESTSVKVELRSGDSNDMNTEKECTDSTLIMVGKASLCVIERMCNSQKGTFRQMVPRYHLAYHTT